MPRLIILSLPILLLWLSFQMGGREKELGRGGVFLSDDLGSRAGRTETGEHGRVSFEGNASEVLQSMRRLGVALENEEVFSVGAAQTRRVDEVMEAIRPSLLGELSPADQRILRSYVSKLTSPLASEQGWLCWGADTTKAKAAAFSEAERLVGLAGSEYSLFANQFLSSGSWNRTATDGFTGGTQGQAVVVTWSIVPDGTSVPGLEGQASAASDFRAWMAEIYGGSVNGPAAAESWFGLFEDAMEAMAETCGITLRYEANDDGVVVNTFNRGIAGERGDIRISARMLDGNSGVLAFAFAPDHGDMVFDSGDSTFDNTSLSSLRLFNTIAHELGHSLGLAHVCPLNQTKLLEPLLTTRFRGPRFDEHQSLQRLYGDALEAAGGELDNDSIANASELDLVEDENLRFKRLSIDDNSDEDYFKFEGLVGQKLSVSVRPGEGIYLEGGESSGGCATGVSFDSGAIHDLSVEVIAPDGVSVLIQADEAGEGGVEQVNEFELDADGVYFVKIAGDTSNAAQLYQVDFRLGDRDPIPSLRKGAGVVLGESGIVKNGRLDPGETLKVAIVITNNGIVATGELVATVRVAENVTLFSQVMPSRIGAGEASELEVVFGASGECGDIATLEFEIADESGVLLEFEEEFQMGDVSDPVPFEADFDDVAGLPVGWASVETGKGEEWTRSSARFSSAVWSAFSPGVDRISDSSLISPSFVLAEGGGTLSFDHLYRTEIGFDGGVLEISRNGGAWFDLVESPLAAVTGGYDREIRTGFDSAIEGREAWSARLNSFLTTSVDLPVDWAGDSLQFRWRLVHDRSSSSDGWWIDNVRMVMSVQSCEPHRPGLELELVSGALNENGPEQNAVLALSSELPLLEEVTVVLERGGDAGSEDFAGVLEVILPAGEEDVEIVLSVLNDELVEGNENLVLTIPEGQAEYARGTDPSESLVIVDRLLIEEWAAGFFAGVVDYAGDSDGDGASELEEYLLGTDPSSAASIQMIGLERCDDGFLIPLRDVPIRSDASLGVEFSSDLEEWESGAFELSDGGLLITPMSDQIFLRLSFLLNE